MNVKSGFWSSSSCIGVSCGRWTLEESVNRSAGEAGGRRPGRRRWGFATGSRSGPGAEVVKRIPRRTERGDPAAAAFSDRVGERSVPRDAVALRTKAPSLAKNERKPPTWVSMLTFGDEAMNDELCTK